MIAFLSCLASFQLGGIYASWKVYFLAGKLSAAIQVTSYNKNQLVVYPCLEIQVNCFRIGLLLYAILTSVLMILMFYVQFTNFTKKTKIS